MRLTEYSHGAGCACKLSPVELGQILGALPPVIDPNVLHASASRDDAAVYRIAPDRALVATVDFFTPIVDDPFEFGAIAAANALSDVYVVGAQPLFALGITAFPRDKLGTGLLDRIVQGGASKLGEAGVTVVGGHSVDDPEPKFGYAVIGEVHPDRVIGHEGASAGDVLFLTKPLCSGLVTTAVKRGLCPPTLERQAVDVMMPPNRQAAGARIGISAQDRRNARRRQDPRQGLDVQAACGGGRGTRPQAQGAQKHPADTGDGQAGDLQHGRAEDRCRRRARPVCGIRRPWHRGLVTWRGAGHLRGPAAPRSCYPAPELGRARLQGTRRSCPR